MELKLLLLVLLHGHLDITHCEVLRVNLREGSRVILYCGKLTDGEVTWSRDTNGQRVDLLTTRNGETTELISDPDRHYGSRADLALSIYRVSQSDAGRYYCGGTTVELSVTSGGASVVEAVLMFGGVGLAALMFLMATVAASREIVYQIWLEGWTAGRDAVLLSSK